MGLFSHCGNLFAVCGMPRYKKNRQRDSVIVYDIRNPKHHLAYLRTAQRRSADIQGAQSIQWTKAGRLFSGDNDGKVRLWNVDKSSTHVMNRNSFPKPENELGGHDGSVTSICLSPDEDFLAVGTNTSRVHLWTFLDNERFKQQFDNCAKLKTGFYY
jgi:WD40 repeat protein